MFRLSVVTAFLFIQITVGSVLPSRPIKVFGSGRITGGRDASSGQFPHQVSLQRLPLRNHFCGGSILNERWIITAAHCTIRERPGSFVAVHSTHLRSSGTAKDVSKVINHENYDDERITNDVAVIQVSQTIVFDSLTRPIPLINRDVLTDRLEVSGWGRISTTGTIPENLQWLETRPVEWTECNRLIGGDLNPDNVCTFIAAGQGVCFGDSGGPLIVPGEGQVGINSFIIEACGAGYPDAYSSIYFHRNWILANAV